MCITIILELIILLIYALVLMFGILDNNNKAAIDLRIKIGTVISILCSIASFGAII